MLTTLLKTSSAIGKSVTSAFTRALAKPAPKTEYQIMLDEEMYFSEDPVLVGLRDRCRHLLNLYNNTKYFEREKRKDLLKQLVNSDDVYIEPPYYADYGIHTKFGKGCYLNYNCTILDVNTVEIGKYCLFAPNVQIYTATHPVDPNLRLSGRELGIKVKIGDYCWIGGNAVICPGVTLGDNVVVAAGAVVTKSFPSNVLIGGNPAKIIKELPPYKGPL